MPPVSSLSAQRALRARPAEGHSPEEVGRLFSYDPVTGLVTRKVAAGRRTHAGDVIGTLDSRKRLIVIIERRKYFVHRIAWCLAHGAWPTKVIDHINGDCHDNRLCNLRDVDSGVNTQNMRRPMKTNRLGILGVSACHKRFVASITVKNRCIHLGAFDTAQEAHAAYVEAKRALHTGCTL